MPCKLFIEAWLLFGQYVANALLMTSVELDLITDLKMLDMIEKQKRGGLTFVGEIC